MRDKILKISKKHNATSPITGKGNINQFWKNIGEIYNRDVCSQQTASQEFSMREIGKIIEQAHDEGTFEMNAGIWKMSVAESSDIQEDARVLIKEDNLLLIRPPFSHNLSIRAIPGHAENGHSTFTQRKPNTDPDAVLKGLEGNNIRGLEELTLNGFKDKSQKTIDEVVYFVEDYFKTILENPQKKPGRTPKRALTREGNPIGGLTFLEKQDIDMVEFMRGFYFASLMDNYDEIRTQVKDIYGYEMGGGDTFAVNNANLMKYGIDINHLTNKDPSGLLKILHDLNPQERTELLTQLKVIQPQRALPKKIDPFKQNWESLKEKYAIDLTKNPHLKNQYIRYNKGLGCSDDTAIFLASFLPQTLSKSRRKNSEISRFTGALLADKIDTLEKNARFLFPGGQDEVVGEYFNQLFQTACKTSRKFRETFNIEDRENEQYNLLPKRTVIDFTAASANRAKEITHSSQRWFYKGIEGTCALSEYVKQMYATMRYLGRGTPSDTKIKNIYHVNMAKETPKVNFTFKQVPLKEIIRIFRERGELVSNPSERERELTKFYLDQ